MKFNYILFFLVFTNCTTVNKVAFESQNLKIINIEEFDKLFGIEAMNTKTNEKIFVISHKQVYWDENEFIKPILNSPISIIEGNDYNFKLKPIKPIVGKFQALGAYIIVNNDTLKSANNYKELPLSFISENSIGLFSSN